MTYWQRILGGLGLFASFAVAPVMAKGKVDIGPAYGHFRQYLNDNKLGSLDLWGFRADATMQVMPDHEWLCGLIMKPSLTLAWGKKSHRHDPSYSAAGVGLGYHIPIGDCFSVRPMAGIQYSRLSGGLGVISPTLGPRPNVKAIFVSTMPYIGLDATWCINPQWMLSGSFVYGWSQSASRISEIEFILAETPAVSYSVMVDYFISPCCSINLAYGFQDVSKEKTGFKADGLRLGVGYSY